MKKIKTLKFLNLVLLASFTLSAKGQALQCPNHISLNQYQRMQAGNELVSVGDWLLVSQVGHLPFPAVGLTADRGGLQAAPDLAWGHDSYRCAYHLPIIPGHPDGFFTLRLLPNTAQHRAWLAALVSAQHGYHSMPGHGGHHGHHHGFHSMPGHGGHHGHHHGFHSMPVAGGHHGHHHGFHSMPVAGGHHGHHHGFHSMPVAGGHHGHHHGFHSMPGHGGHHGFHSMPGHGGHHGHHHGHHSMPAAI